MKKILSISLKAISIHLGYYGLIHLTLQTLSLRLQTSRRGDNIDKAVTGWMNGTFTANCQFGLAIKTKRK